MAPKAIEFGERTQNNGHYCDRFHRKIVCDLLLHVAIYISHPFRVIAN